MIAGALSSALLELPDDDIEVRRVERWIGHGTATAWIADCSLGGDAAQLFCKRSGPAARSSSGHRRGIACEAKVYSDVLSRIDLPSPRFFGAAVDAAGGGWLFLENLAGAHSIDLCEEAESALSRAAAWSGAFHAATEGLVGAPATSFLRPYDIDYYRGWAARAERFAGPKLGEVPWLPAVCERWPDLAEEMLVAPSAVIHGEFYPKNILYRDGVVYPVDWETAAVGPGEIDLACLVERWPAPVADACEDAYRRARWPKVAPDGFSRTLDVARVYVLFRWLGEKPKWTLAPASRERFERLRGLAERVGLI